MTTSGSCTTVPFTASDYTQRVYGDAMTTASSDSSSGSGSSPAGVTSVSQGGAAGPIVTSPPCAIAVGAALAGLAML